MKNMMTRTKTLAGAGMVMAAVIGASALPAWATGPVVQLGAVAQRYPWSGTLDVDYKASGLPEKGTNAVVTVTANGQTYAQDAVISSGTNTVQVTNLPKNVKAKDAKVTLKIK